MEGRDAAGRDRVRCAAACGWEGWRRYVSVDDIIGRHAGFGPCPTCGSALVHRPARYQPGRSKLASLPSTGLR